MAEQQMQIGVVLPIGEDDQTQQTLPYRAIRDVAQRVEAAGLDSVWVFDHLLFRFGDKPTVGIWECWTLLSAIAAATERVQLGSIVMCTAFRNPALLAKMADTLDEISAGRVILGLGAGWHQPEFDAFGIPFDHRVDRFEEALKIITPLLREGKADFNGTYTSASNCELRPRGPRPNGPPILVGAFKPRMLRLTARYADAWNTCWLGQPSALDQPRAALLAACAEEGRDPATIDVTVGVSLKYVAPGEDVGEIDPDKMLVGSSADIATAFRGYAERGASHLICSLNETHDDAITWLAEAARLARS